MNHRFVIYLCHRWMSSTCVFINLISCSCCFNTLGTCYKLFTRVTNFCIIWNILNCNFSLNNVLTDRTNFNNSWSHRLSFTSCSSWIKQCTIISIHIVSNYGFTTTSSTSCFSFLKIFFKTRFSFITSHNRNRFCNNIFITYFNNSINFLSIFNNRVWCNFPSGWVHSITSRWCFNTILTFNNCFFSFDRLIRISFITSTFCNCFCFNFRFST